MALLWFSTCPFGFADNQKGVETEETNALIVYYVTTAGSDVNNGLSWGTSFATVQKAIDIAFANSANTCEVWVATGTYFPTKCLSDADGLQTANVYKSFIMYSGVNVYGGFYGNETSRGIGATGGRQLVSNGKAWEFAYPTILDGSSTLSYHVVWFGSNGFRSFSYSGINVQIPENLTSLAIMDGFTISGGFANLNITIENTNDSKKRYVHNAGGGAALVGNGELHNCIIKNNRARYGGAGIAMFNGARIINCFVLENEAVGARFYNKGIFGIGAFNYWRTDGAGIVSVGDKTKFCFIEGSTIHNNLGRANDNYPGLPTATNNKTNNGGGVYLVYTTMINSIVSGNNIVMNPSAYAGGSSASCGGGAYIFKNGVINNCEITDNGFLTGSQNGAGMFIADYSQEATSYNDLVVKNSYVHSNRAGGAIAVDAQYSTIINTIVANNQSGGIAGYGNCRRSRTVNCIIYNNPVGWSHSTSTKNKENTLINSTVVNNGTAISIGNTNSHKIHNCIVWGNGTNTATNATTVSYSAFSGTPPIGTSNIQLDVANATGPKFENPTSGRGLNVSGWENASWKLELNSDCIDKGNYALVSGISTTDIDGQPRLQGSFVDLGAYESPTNLPVELVLFNAQCAENDVLLKWSTFSETNNDYFSIYKSKDKSSFILLTTISGAGNSNIQQVYTFTDDNNSAGTYYYQLFNTDYDGTENFAAITYADCSSFNKHIEATSLNDAINVYFTNFSDEYAVIKVINYNGQTLFETSLNIENNQHQETIATSRLPSGIYYLVAITKDNLFSKGFSIVK